MRIPRRRPTRELVPLPPAEAIAVREFRLPHFTHGWHVHPEIELTLILRGRGLRCVHDSLGAFEEGDLCLVGGETPHCWLSEPLPGDDVRSIVVQFRPALLERVRPLELAAPIERLFGAAKRGIRLEGELRKRTAAAMIDLHGRGALRRFTGLLDLLAGIAEQRTFSFLGSSAAVRPGVADAKLTSLLHELHADPEAPLGQAAAAARFGMTASAFSRHFRRRIGKTYVSYVAETRISRACVELLHTDDSIADVAFACGFGTLASFNRWFKRLRGVTPRAFRSGHSS